MNREIKFRAWDRVHSEWSKRTVCSLENLFDCPTEGLVNEINLLFDNESTDIYGLVWMQYTGLKDKNGKEIYEGDIVKRDVVCSFREDYSDIKKWINWDTTSQQFLSVYFGSYNNGGVYEDYSGGNGWYLKNEGVKHTHTNKRNVWKLETPSKVEGEISHYCFEENDTVYGFDEVTPEEVGVIGNIYENPELLKEEA